MRTPEERFESHVRALLAAARTTVPDAETTKILAECVARLDSERSDLAAAEQFEREQREGEVPWGETA